MSLSTVRTRDADTAGTSGLNLTIGAISCIGQDNR